MEPARKIKDLMVFFQALENANNQQRLVNLI
jgi:hypothetical protein